MKQEMVADYEHKALSEDGFNQSIHFVINL
jgi:hypothetical protein